MTFTHAFQTRELSPSFVLIYVNVGAIDYNCIDNSVGRVVCLSRHRARGDCEWSNRIRNRQMQSCTQELRSAIPLYVVLYRCSWWYHRRDIIVVVLSLVLSGNGSVHTVLGNMRKRVKLDYTRHIVNMDDGGIVALDYIAPLGVGNADVVPTIICLPGLTGSSREFYMTNFISLMLKKGWRYVTVVMVMTIMM